VSMNHDGLVFSLDPRRYQLGGNLGAGSYGCVIGGEDRICKRQVAIKQIPRLYDHLQMSKKVIREVRLLHSLRHENIISLYDLELGDSSIYIITELCVTDLKKVIHSEKVHASLRPVDHISMMYQILNGIEFMHSVGVIHRDIKPANILLDNHLNVKLCDFGLARVIVGDFGTTDASKDAYHMTEYVVTRWYRAPEIVISPGLYGKAQDVWSAGCTFSELFRRKPLFPGNSVLNQLQTIVDVMGKPTEADLDFGISSRARRFMNALNSENRGLAGALQKSVEIHSALSDLLVLMLAFNPNRRITAAQALKHVMFEEYRRTATSSSNSGGSENPANRKKVSNLLHSIAHSLKTIDNCANTINAYKNLMEAEVAEIKLHLRMESSDFDTVSSTIDDEVPLELLSRRKSVQSSSSNGPPRTDNTSLPSLHPSGDLKRGSLSNVGTGAATGQEGRDTNRRVLSASRISEIAGGGGGLEKLPVVRRADSGSSLAVQDPSGGGSGRAGSEQDTSRGQSSVSESKGTVSTSLDSPEVKAAVDERRGWGRRARPAWTGSHSHDGQIAPPSSAHPPPTSIKPKTSYSVSSTVVAAARGLRRLGSSGGSSGSSSASRGQSLSRGQSPDNSATAIPSASSSSALNYNGRSSGVGVQLEPIREPGRTSQNRSVHSNNAGDAGAVGTDQHVSGTTRLDYPPPITTQSSLSRNVNNPFKSSRYAASI